MKKDNFTKKHRHASCAPPPSNASIFKAPGITLEVIMNHLGWLFHSLKKNGWVDKYLVKRNSYQLLSAPVSIWLARTRLLEGKTKHFIFYHQSPFLFPHLQLLHPRLRLNILTKQELLLRWSVSCETVSFMHEANPHTSQSLCHFIRKASCSARALVCAFFSTFLWNLSYWQRKSWIIADYQGSWLKQEKRIEQWACFEPIR